jgi:hypothetical protein
MYVYLPKFEKWNLLLVVSSFLKSKAANFVGGVMRHVNWPNRMRPGKNQMFIILANRYHIYGKIFVCAGVCKHKMPSRATSGFLLEATYSFYCFGYGSCYLDYKMDKLNRKAFFKCKIWPCNYQIFHKGLKSSRRKNFQFVFFMA